MGKKKVTPGNASLGFGVAVLLAALAYEGERIVNSDDGPSNTRIEPVPAVLVQSAHGKPVLSTKQTEENSIPLQTVKAPLSLSELAKKLEKEEKRIDEKVFNERSILLDNHNNDVRRADCRVLDYSVEFDGLNVEKLEKEIKVDPGYELHFARAGVRMNPDRSIDRDDSATSIEVGSAAIVCPEPMATEEINARVEMLESDIKNHIVQTSQDMIDALNKCTGNDSEEDEYDCSVAIPAITSTIYTVDAFYESITDSAYNDDLLRHCKADETCRTDVLPLEFPPGKWKRDKQVQAICERYLSAVDKRVEFAERWWSIYGEYPEIQEYFNEEHGFSGKIFSKEINRDVEIYNATCGLMFRRARTLNL